MSDSTPAIAGVQKCGCVTYVNSDPDQLDAHDRKAIGRIVSEGGQIIRSTVGEIKAMPAFLPAECPHNPPGWTREQPKAPNRIRYRKTHRGTVRRVSILVPGWEQRGYPAGEVRKRDGKWWATEGWFNMGAGANRGDEQRTPCDELGPFTSQRKAAEALIPATEVRAAQMLAAISGGRDQDAA